MRFLNTTSLQFEEIPDSELHLAQNKYAILSHRWGPDKEEVTYEAIISQTNVSHKKGWDKIKGLSQTNVSNRKGWDKIKGFCYLAAKEGCRYGWVDTCCINKGNSSELSEAINSMYLWYRQSYICFAYLEDVPRKVPQSDFEDSEWFDRGWTLQELIAPRIVSFFDENWVPLGKKSQWLNRLSGKTRIPMRVLFNPETKLSSYSVAQRMSWAAKRITKRIEDRAYSLMGLFDISMPMIYGEREKAFLRLQQEIIRKSRDDSIFAWNMGPPNDDSRFHTGLYAPSPLEYIDCSNVLQEGGSKGFSEINGDLQIQLRLLPHSPGTFLASLHCSNDVLGPSGKSRIAIVIAKTSNEDEYVRVRDPSNISNRLVPLSLLKHAEERQIRVSIDSSEPPINIFFGFWLRTLRPPDHDESRIDIFSNSPTLVPDHIHQISHEDGNTGIVRIRGNGRLVRPKWSHIRWIKFGFSKNFDPIIWLANDGQSERLDKTLELLAHERWQPGRPVHTILMKEDLVQRYEGEPAGRLLREPRGAWMVKVDSEKGLVDFVIDQLKIKMSVQLLPFIGPTRSPSGRFKQLRPMMVWVVDITETIPRPGKKDEGRSFFSFFKR